MPTKHALVIASSEYRDSRLARLVTPGQDARRLAEVLADSRVGEFDDVITLMNESEGTIRRAISRFVGQRRRDDLVLLYFSGHGVLDEQGLLYFAALDTEPDALSATGIAAAFVRQELDRSSSRCQVLILDCCHSGAVARGTKGAPGRSVGTATVFSSRGTGRVTLTATDATQYAWEGDNVIGHADNSVFTYYLAQGLETGEADLNRDGQISLDELYDYVHDQVVTVSPKQTPGKFAEAQHGRIVIARNPPRISGGSPHEIDPRVVPNRGPAALQISTPALTARFDSVAASVALDRLDKDDRGRFDALGILAADVPVPADVLMMLWTCKLEDALAQRDRVVEMRALAGHIQASGDGLMMTSAVRDALHQRLGQNAVILHESLLAQVRPRSGDWMDLRPDAVYWWKHIVRHLKGANFTSECQGLMTHVAFLRRRLQLADSTAVLADFENLTGSDGRTLQRVFRAAIDIITDDGSQLEGQLIARLQPGVSPLLDGVLAEAARGPNGPWLRPATDSLRSSKVGSADVRHSGVVSRVTTVGARRAASASSDRTVRIWDLEHGTCLRTLEGHQQPVRALTALRPDRLVSGSVDSTLRVWDPETGVCIRSLEGHTAGVTAIEQMGNDIISGTEAGTLRLWNVNTGATRVIFEGHSSTVTALAAQTKPPLLASGTVDGAIRLWEVVAGKTTRYLDGHIDAIAALAFASPYLVSASWDSTVRVWDLGKPEHSSVLPHNGPVRAITMPQPELVVSGGADHILRAWSVPSGIMVRAMSGHQDTIVALATLNSETVLSGSADRTVRVWALETGTNVTSFTFDAPVTALTVDARTGRIVVGDASGRVHVLRYEGGEIT